MLKDTVNFSIICKKSGRVKRIVYIIAGSVVLTLLITLLVIFLWPSSRQYIGSFKVSGNQPGIYSNEEVSFQVVADRNCGTADLEVFRVRYDAENQDGIEDEAQYSYEVRGPRSAFSNHLTVELPLPEDICKMITENVLLAEQLFIMADHQGYDSHPYNQCLISELLKPELNLQKKTLSVEYRFRQLKNEDSVYHIAFHWRFYKKKVEYYYLNASSNTKDKFFKVLVDRPFTNKSYQMAQEVITELNQRKHQLELLNFDFLNPKYQQLNYPVCLRFADLPDSVAMRYVAPKGFPHKGWMELNANQYFDENPADLDQDEREELSKAIGRTMLCLTQDVYGDLLWADEAMSNWYEAVVLKNPHYISKQVIDNLDFIQQAMPQKMPDRNDETAKANFMKYVWGSSCLTTFLGIQTDAFYYGRMYENRYADTEADLLTVINRALEPERLCDIFPLFLDTYIRYPERIYPALTTDILQDQLESDRMQLTLKASGSKLRLAWDRDDVKQARMLTEADSQTAGLLYVLGDMQVKILQVDIEADSDALALLQQDSHRFYIRVKGDEQTGVLVYQPRDKELIPFLPNQQYLSPDGERQLILRSISPLYLLVFNRNDQAAKSKNRKIAIGFSYRALKPPA